MSPYISDIYKSLGFVLQPSLRGLFRALFKGEGGVDHARFGHDEYPFAPGFAKVARATQNAELRRGPDLGQWGNTPQDDLPLGKHRGAEALHERVQGRDAEDRTDPSTRAHFGATIVEQVDVVDDPVAELRVGWVTDKGLLNNMGGNVDEFRVRLA
jgi:hypothetical protein